MRLYNLEAAYIVGILLSVKNQETFGKNLAQQTGESIINSLPFIMIYKSNKIAVNVAPNFRSEFILRILIKRFAVMRKVFAEVSASFLKFAISRKMYLLKECNNILSANNYLDVEQVRNCIKTTTLGASSESRLDMLKSQVSSFICVLYLEY